MWIVLSGMGVVFAVLGILLLVMIFLDKPIKPQKKERGSPMIGTCRISAFAMSSHVVQKLGFEVNPHNHLLIRAAGASSAGQIASMVAGRVMLILVPVFL